LISFLKDYTREQIVRVSKTIHAPIEFVYKWCTDFRDDDYAIIQSKKKRKVLFKTKRKVVYYQYYIGDDKVQKIIVNIVTLKPPNSWHLECFGEEDDEIGDYRLMSLSKNKTKLEMVFTEKWKISRGIPNVQKQVKQTSRFWDRYIDALMNDFHSLPKNK
jgi:hypothetical protein